MIPIRIAWSRAELLDFGADVRGNWQRFGRYSQRFMVVGLAIGGRKGQAKQRSIVNFIRVTDTPSY